MAKTITPENESAILEAMKKMAGLVSEQDADPTDALYAVSKSASFKPPLIHLLAHNYNVSRSAIQREEDTLMGKLASFPLADAEKVCEMIYGQTPKDVKKMALFNVVSSDWSEDILPSYKQAEENTYYFRQPKSETYSSTPTDLPLANLPRYRKEASLLEVVSDKLAESAFLLDESIKKIACYLKTNERMSNEQVVFGARELFGEKSVDMIKRAAIYVPGLKITNDIPTEDLIYSDIQQPFCFIKEASLYLDICSELDAAVTSLTKRSELKKTATKTNKNNSNSGSSLSAPLSLAEIYSADTQNPTTPKFQRDLVSNVNTNSKNTIPESYAALAERDIGDLAAYSQQVKNRTPGDAGRAGKERFQREQNALAERELENTWNTSRNNSFKSKNVDKGKDEVDDYVYERNKKNKQRADEKSKEQKLSTKGYNRTDEDVKDLEDEKRRKQDKRDHEQDLSARLSAKGYNQAEEDAKDKIERKDNKDRERSYQQHLAKRHLSDEDLDIQERHGRQARLTNDAFDRFGYKTKKTIDALASPLASVINPETVSNVIVGMKSLIPNKEFDPKEIKYVAKPSLELDRRVQQIKSDLNELITDDPVISGYPKEVVLNVANKLMRSSPAVMLNPMLMQATLREALSKGGGLGLFDMKALSDAEKDERIRTLSKKEFKDTNKSKMIS